MSVLEKITGLFKRYKGDPLAYRNVDVFSGRQYGEKFDYLNLYRKGSWVYACVQKISNPLAAANWRLMKGEKEYKAHRALKILDKPNQYMSRYELMNMTAQSLELIGEAHWLIIRAGTGKPTALFPLNPSKMELLFDNGTPAAWEYTVNQQNRQRLEFEDVVFFKYTDPANPWRGVSPLHAAAIAADTDLDASRWNRIFFKNSAKPSSTIETDGKIQEDQKLRLKKQIEAYYSGVNNAHKTIVLDSGLKFRNVQLSHKDMEFLELRKYSREEIAAVYGVPLSKLGLNENSNRATAYIHDYTFAKETLTPKLRMIQGALDKYFLQAFEEGLHFEFDSVIPSDEETTAKINQIYINAGVLTPDEVREELGYEPLKKNEPEKQLTKAEGLELQKRIRKITDPAEKDIKGWVAARFEQQRKEMLRRLKQVAQEKGLTFPEANRITEYLAGWITQRDEEEYFTFYLSDKLKNPVKESVGEVIDEYGIGINFDQFDENIENMLFRRGQRFAQQINETTYNDLRVTLVDQMVEQGLNERDMTAMINSVMTLNKRQRPATIARTELFSAINESTQITFKEAGIQKKKWLAGFDERTRPAHAAASGQVQKQEEPFYVGGDRLQYPGDPSGSPGNIINCRCTLIPVME